MEKTLTITVPSYNVEKTLKETVLSLLEPTILNDLEVLIVNDGSKDSTSMIAHELEKRFPKTIRVIDKKNGGHGSTINTGIKEAKGKYFKIVDGDDWLITENLSKFLENLKNTEADLVYNPFYEVNDKTKERELIGKFDSSFNTSHEYSFSMLAKRIKVPMHATTYKTSILKDNKIQVDEHRFYVDAEYVIMPVPYIHTIQILNDPLYLYRVFSDTQSMSVKNMQKNVQHHLDVTLHMLEYYLKVRNSLSDEKEEYIRNRVLDLIQMQYQIYFSFPFDWKVTKDIAKFNKAIYEKDKKIYNESNGKMVRFIRIQPQIFYPLIKLREKVR
ncbi:glycosyltransferase family 2 protein [Dubosiella newyorkensis]|uniref:glycosyltransferase family 2 protein n=1 Tax=Dubosiella newyorkensis TaxID=1862672 RepID=UPI00272DB64D|nr:glycosyltransferase family 2 protein [Dubosiella newyorkensis]